MSERAPVRVFVIDDEPMVRFGFRMFLREMPAFAWCGEADSVAHALAQGPEARPDVTVIDAELDGGGGFVLMREWLHRGLHALAWLGRCREETVREALRNGAQGVASKRDTLDALLEGLLAGWAGAPWLSPLAASAIAGDWQRPPAVGAGPTPDLSPRQGQIYRQLGNGATVHEIAHTLGIATKTVHAHVERMKIALSAPSLAALRMRATLDVGRGETAARGDGTRAER